ncbi:Dihydroorotate dehydrogenase-domain-containing protein [Protomyces lactucae-debilis]|uniref:Dihydroorotate dehydrogenase (quinone), mitochondrial n=1 Tax=Protomyces lactucae-debilis TaxID=2754530 RepID=A0A1Y2FKM5_PROLT|nr:Dihydroorotate dehydrogenase-domain-containing protein [Protomyces lactucae-debilis]ORY83766.1 Dihydroorotate dehydrogenase-domain-containing protein [Protomyces lactucae-debilis]
MFSTRQTRPLLPHARTLFTRRKPAGPIRSTITTTLTITGLVLGGYYLSDSRAGFYTHIAMPVLRATTDAETSHSLAIRALSMGLTARDTATLSQEEAERLGFSLWGRDFESPIGLAAGLDKQAEGIDGLFNLGFSYVEVGSVTPQPQPGNPKPRYFRLPKDNAVINRYGFNSEGHANVAARLAARGDRKTPGKVLALNLGKNKNGDEVSDYVRGVEKLGPYADVLVINVSSPNTPGLRTLQHGDALSSLLGAVRKARDTHPNKHVQGVPLLVKIAPDLSTEELAGIAQILVKQEIDGCIVSNTTLARPSSLQHQDVAQEAGGLSGAPLKPMTMQALKTLKSHLRQQQAGDKVRLIACGGISSGQDVLDYFDAGASFVQAYTAFGYEGPRFPRRIREELFSLLKARNTTVSELIAR